MFRQENDSALLDPSPTEPFSIDVTDVTGTHSLTADDVPPMLPAGKVALALARRLSLPESPWTLRDDNSAAFLDDDVPIGRQIRTGGKLTLTSKTHLG